MTTRPTPHGIATPDAEQARPSRGVTIQACCVTSFRELQPFLATNLDDEKIEFVSIDKPTECTVHHTVAGEQTVED